MAKLVVLNAGLTGRSYDLNADKTTVGRVEDNTMQIAEASVSSHHCEILVKGDEVLIKDLNSTNGTFISGEKISEGVLKPGQILRLGQVELRLEGAGTVPAAPAPATVPAPAPATPPPSRKPAEQTIVMQRGVSLDELGQGPRGVGFDTSKAFSKKNNQTNKLFLIIGIIAIVIIGGIFLYSLTVVKK